MAYGLLLYKEIETPQGSQRVEIYKDGFTGSAVEIAGLHADGITISKDSQSLTQPITTSVLTLRLSDCNELDYSQFFTPNATLFKVVWQTINGTTTTTRWTGFITPDSYSENLAYRDTLTLTARDNLGRLNDYDFDLEKGQMLSVRAILNAAMTKAGVAMGLTYTTTKVATSPATVLAVDGLVNTTLLQGMTWHAAVELLLTGLGLTLAWNDGNAFEVRDISQAPASTQTSFFINKSGYRQIRPAWKNLVVGQDYGLRSSFYEGQFTKEQCGDNPTFSIPSSSKWDYGGTIALLNPYKGAAYPYETIYLPIQGGDSMSNRIAYVFPVPANLAPIKISFRANNTAWIWDDGIVERTSLGTRVWPYGGYVLTPYAIRFRCNIFCNVGGTTYILRDEWKVYDASTIEDPYLFFMMPPALTERSQVSAVDADNEVSIYIGTPPGAGLVSVVFYEPNVCGRDVIASRSDDPADYALALKGTDWVTPYAKMTNLTMSVDDGIAGRSMSVSVNPAHNMRGELSVSLGQVPTGKGNTLLYLGGLFYDDTYYTPLTAFAKAQNGTNYDLLELVGREYISYQNAAYNALSGTMKQSALFRFDKGISYDGNTYRIVGASLAILSNTLSAQMLQQEASFDTAAHTVESVDEEGSAQSSTATGGIAQGTQAGVDWFIQETYEEDGETKQRLKLNPDYTGMYAEGWITAGGLGSGSGEAGGSLATLADVTLTNLAAGDILRYDATTSHWLNGPLAVALASLTDVAIGTPSNGQALVYDSTLGKWKPGNVGGGGEVVVVSEDATIGTSLTLLATVAGTPIKAKIAAYLLAADFTAANIVSTLGNTAVNRATKDSDGSTINHTYAAGLNTHQNRIYLQAPDNTLLAAYLDGSDIKPVIGVAATDTIATTAWVGQQGYLTSSAISDMATMTWVGQQGYLTSSAISDMATKTWVGQQGYITSSALTGYATQTWVGQQGYLTSASLSGYAKDILVSSNKIYLRDGSSTLSTSYLDASDIVSVLGDTPVNRANKDGDGNTITVAYLRKNTDDTMAGNLTIGGRTSTSAAKTLTVYGQTSATYPALAIYGVASASTRYLTNIYRDSTALHIDSSVSVTGNIIATGYIDAGASASDRRLKKDIKTMDFADADYVLASLRPVTFAWNEKASELGPLSGDSRGFLADEYNRIIPNATRKMWGEYDAIDYHQVIPYLVAGWQLQQKRIEALSEKIEKLRRRLGDGI